MNIIKEIIWAVKSGSHSGKGNKYTRIGDFTKALHHYKLALKYSSENNGSRAIFQECISRSYARLGNYKMALTEAEKCLETLNSVDSTAKSIVDAKSRIENLIGAIKSNDSGAINRALAI